MASNFTFTHSSGVGIRPARLTDEQLDQRVTAAFVFYVGKDHPIGRWELVAHIFGAAAAFPQDDSNMYDRQIRESIARLRRGGALICNMGDGRGMYIAANQEEYNEFRAYYGSAAFEKLEIIRGMDAAANEQFPDRLQMKLL